MTIQSNDQTIPKVHKSLKTVNHGGGKNHTPASPSFPHNSLAVSKGGTVYSGRKVRKDTDFVSAAAVFQSVIIQAARVGEQIGTAKTYEELRELKIKVDRTLRFFKIEAAKEGAFSNLSVDVTEIAKAAEILTKYDNMIRKKLALSRQTLSTKGLDLLGVEIKKINNLKCEGIFRVPGKKNEITEIRSELDRFLTYQAPTSDQVNGIKAQLEFSDTYDLCGVYKSIIQTITDDSNEGIIPESLVHKFISIDKGAGSSDDAERSVKERKISAVLQCVQGVSQTALFSLLDVCHSILQHAELNEMNARNLAISVMKSCYKDPSEGDISTKVELLAKYQEVSIWLIENYMDITQSLEDGSM